MKAVLSSTYDDNYFFFIPITVWCWNRLDIECIVFLPPVRSMKDANKIVWLSRIIDSASLKLRTCHFICTPDKEATYAQCVRLYAAALPGIHDDDVLITSDVDMAVFRDWYFSGSRGWNFYILGYDLVPAGQYPMCYIYAHASRWRASFANQTNDYQFYLDKLLGHIQTDNMRGNYWAKDQEEAYRVISEEIDQVALIARARPGTQFADKRVDRDDAYWKDHLTPDLIDAHLWRPGFEENNFQNILYLLKHYYADQPFEWLVEAKNQYISIV